MLLLIFYAAFDTQARPYYLSLLSPFSQRHMSKVPIIWWATVVVVREIQSVFEVPRQTDIAALKLKTLGEISQKFDSRAVHVPEVLR